MDRAMTPPHLFTAIDHVGIAVPDLDEAIALLRDDLRHAAGARGGQRGAGRPRGDAGRRRLRARCIQLLAPLTPDSTIAKFLDRSGPGVQQVAYRVTDIERGQRDAARARRAAAVRRAARAAPPDTRINFIHPKDAGGVLVELVEPAARTEPCRPRTSPPSDRR